jgi:rod shape-determining protein MreC
LCVIASLLLLMILSRDNPRVERLRQGAFDVLVPIIDTLGAPFIALRNTGQRFGQLGELRALNDQLAAENEVLRMQVAELTQAKILMQQYRDLLALPAEPDFEFIPLRVVADLSSPFVKTLITVGGSDMGIRPGLAVMGANGIVGRVISVGAKSSRILLVTDFNSKIPVVALSSDVQAILAGRNEARPFLQYVPPKAKLKQGDLLVTSGRGGQVPIGLPVGTVRAIAENGEVDVALLDDVRNLVYVRVAKIQKLSPPPAAAGPIIGASAEAE